MTTFADLGLSDELLAAIKDVGYDTPTPIQAQAIPPVMQMRDVLGCAQTGTGKTAGFTLPMIDILSEGRARARMPRSLILEPTRELATQVAENFKTYGKNHPKLSMALLIGGENMAPQIAKLERGVDVLIATPGRLIDLQERGKIMLNDIKIFVIDEADRMMDMGFIPDIEKISSLLPFTRQTLFFSATMSSDMKKLADKFLSNPKEVTVSPPASTAANIKHSRVNLATTDAGQKREALRKLLKGEKVQNAFIFCNRKRDVATLHKSLGKHGFNSGALHGDLDQSTRTETLDSFRAGDISLLVCSDVAARGLDIADVSHVFNFDVPFNAEDYVHRIGRTGRAGKAGSAYTLVTPSDDKFITAVQALIKQDIAETVIADLPVQNASVTRLEKGSSKPDRHVRRTQTANKRHPTKAKSEEPKATTRAKPPQESKRTHIATVHETAFDESNMPSFMRPRKAFRAK